MGDYTLLHLELQLKADIPAGVRQLLTAMVAGEGDQCPKELIPVHPLFTTDSRWSWMMRCSSAYFDESTTCSLAGNQLLVQFNVKNYNGEIENFVDWIMPYVDAVDGQQLGYSRFNGYDQRNRLLFYGCPYRWEYQPQPDDNYWGIS